MAVDEALAARVRARVSRHAGWSERRMFGGLAFLVDGNMAVGVTGSDLMVRVGRDGDDEALSRPGARPFAMTGRPMAGWVLVGPEGYGMEPDLAAWIDEGLAFASGLPPK